MNFEFSLAQLTVLNTSPIEISKIAHECGYDYVSLRQIYMNLPDEQRFELIKDKKMFNELKVYLNDTGLKVLDVELARIYDGVNVKDYEPIFELSVNLGVRNILSSIWTNEKSYYIEQFNILCELAKQYDLDVNLEYVPIAGVDTMAKALEVIETVKTENARLLVDMHHFHRAKDSVKELQKVPNKYFNFVHLCDACKEIPSDIEEMKRIMRQERLYVGEGGIEIKDILNSMPIVPYSIELPNKAQVDKNGYAAHAEKCLDTAKQYVNKYVTGRK